MNLISRLTYKKRKVNTHSQRLKRLLKQKRRKGGKRVNLPLWKLNLKILIRVSNLVNWKILKTLSSLNTYSKRNILRKHSKTFKKYLKIYKLNKKSLMISIRKSLKIQVIFWIKLLRLTPLKLNTRSLNNLRRQKYLS